MALNTELILTLKNLKGCGNKTVLSIAEVAPSQVQTIKDLSDFWTTLKGKKFEKFTTTDLQEANRKALTIINDAEKEGVGIISYYEEAFPQILRETVNEDGNADAPLILFYRGNIKALQMPGIAIIGTRAPSEAGTQAGIYFAEKFAAEGFNIVSGLAIGCDTTGHQGALNVKGTTTAFLANGLDWKSIYPKENLELAKNIVENGGLLLSEYPVGQRGNRYTLVERDRLQAGLSYATLVIQTSLRGGTMHAVNATIKAQKPLFMIRYKNMNGQTGGKAEGNRVFLEEGKAHALTSGSFEEALAIIRESVERINKPKIKNSLF